MLAGATFEVRSGELVALVDRPVPARPSVMRVIAGLDMFQSGTVQVEEVALHGGGAVHAPAALRTLRAKVGLVFQFHHLFEHLSAIKNIWLAPVYARGVPQREAERRARELLAALGSSIATTPCARAVRREARGRIARALAVDRRSCV